MKKWLVLGLLSVTALAAFAGTCVISNGRLTTIGSKKIFAAQMDNNSGVDILQHNFIVAFVDSSGNVLETKTIEGCLRSLQDGGTNYYSVKSTTAAANVANSLSRIAFDSNFKVGQTESSNITLDDACHAANSVGRLSNRDPFSGIHCPECAAAKQSFGGCQSHGPATDLHER